MSGDVPVKVCASCGVDVSGRPRVKDSQGRYLCKPCLEKVQARKAARAPEPIGLAAEPDAVMSGLLAGSGVGARCPHCGLAMRGNAVICVRCGYNAASGEAITTEIARMPEVELVREGRAGGVSLAMPGMWILGSIALSVLGGLLGSILWYAVRQGIGWESGWIAIGVGFLAGLGAAMGARDNAGIFTGIIACVVALLAVVTAKYQVASAEYSSFMVRAPDEFLAREILAAAVQEEAGTRTRAAPLGRRRFAAWQVSNMSDREAEQAARDIWDNDMTGEDRQTFLAELAATQEAMRADPFGEKLASVQADLGLFDVIFGVIAVVAALGAGSGGRISFGEE